MIIKAFLSAEGVNSLFKGGTCEGSSRIDPQRKMFVETLIDTHEYSVSAGEDPTVAMSYFTFGPRIRNMGVMQQVQQQEAKAPTPAPTPPAKTV